MNSIVEELVAMVGGNGSHLGSSGTFQVQQRRPKAAVQHQDVKMLPPAAKPGRKAERTKGTSPEQIIPLEDGDFKDF
jgi:hypothetical protein